MRSCETRESSKLSILKLTLSGFGINLITRTVSKLIERLYRYIFVAQPSNHHNSIADGARIYFQNVTVILTACAPL